MLRGLMLLLVCAVLGGAYWIAFGDRPASPGPPAAEAAGAVPRQSAAAPAGDAADAADAADAGAGGSAAAAADPAADPATDPATGAADGAGRDAVVARHAAALTVSGWIGSEAQRVDDVVVHASPSAGVTDADFRGTPPRTEQALAGRHLLWLEHHTPAGTLRCSAPVGFELVPGEPRTLHVELLPSRRVSGRLGDSVRRPVRDGRVVLRLWHEGVELGLTREAEVDASGAFAIGDLPPAWISLSASCAGHRSARGAPVRDTLLTALPELFEDPDGLPRWITEVDTVVCDLRERDAAVTLPMAPTDS